jgi:hypothetical protein
MAWQQGQQWTAQWQQLNGDGHGNGRRDGNTTAMELMAMNGNGRRNGNLKAKDSAGQIQWTARWLLDGDGQCNGNLRASDDAMATQRQWTMRKGASVTAMLARPAVGATKANVASKHKM